MKHGHQSRDACVWDFRAARPHRRLAQTASTIKAADRSGTSLPIEKGASLRMRRRCGLSKATKRVPGQRGENSPRRWASGKVDFVGWEDINQQDRGDVEQRRGPDVIIGFSDAPQCYATKLIEPDDVAPIRQAFGGWMFLPRNTASANKSNAWKRIAVRRRQRPAGVSQIDRAGGRL